MTITSGSYQYWTICSSDLYSILYYSNPTYNRYIGKSVLLNFFERTTWLWVLIIIQTTLTIHYTGRQTFKNMIQLSKKEFITENINNLLYTSSKFFGMSQKYEKSIRSSPKNHATYSQKIILLALLVILDKIIHTAKLTTRDISKTSTRNDEETNGVYLKSTSSICPSLTWVNIYLIFWKWNSKSWCVIEVIEGSIGNYLTRVRKYSKNRFLNWLPTSYRG